MRSACSADTAAGEHVDGRDWASTLRGHLRRTVGGGRGGKAAGAPHFKTITEPEWDNPGFGPAGAQPLPALRERLQSKPRFKTRFTAAAPSRQ
jgi:hypothetical protein